MADHVTDPEDFSALWGAQADGGLHPELLQVPASDDAPEPEAIRSPTNGAGDNGHVTVVDHGVREGVARLAQAIAVNQVDVVRKGDLEALRVELEGTFTHQLAVALYEVLAASNDRFAATEDRIIQRMTETMDGHGVRLVASMEECQLVSLEAVEAMRSEVGAVRGRLNGPIDALAAFQRDMRHEVSRVGDMVVSEGATIARRADIELAELTAAREELTNRLDRGDARADEAAGERTGVSATLSTVRDDVSSLRKEIAELRQALESSARPAPKLHWWRRFC